MRIRVGLPALFIVLVLIADVVLLMQQDQSTAVKLEDAVAGFRARTAATEVTTTTAPAGTASPAAPGAAPATTVARASTPTAKAGAPAASAPASTTPFTVPAEGVYSYRTRGYEEISIGGGRHDYPERSYASVRATGGCAWEFKHEVVKEHVEQRTHCSAPGAISQTHESADIVFFNQHNVANYQCEPPVVYTQVGDAPGTKRSGTCRADDGQAVITTTLVGRERITVAGVAIEAVHLVVDGVASGRADGTSHGDVWLHPDTALLLKSNRKVQTRANAYGTTITYREDASFELEKLDPAR